MPRLEEFDLLISGLQHFSFCLRQWGLIHIENEWADNFLTLDGSIKHDRADDPFFTEKRGSIIVSRSLPIRSNALGVVGKCDVVEFHEDPKGVPLAGRSGKWSPIPIEYKRGVSKDIDADRLQLCAEAICLEEMFCCSEIPSAFLFYVGTKKREEVPLTAELRKQTVDDFREMRRLFERGHTPKVKPGPKCRSCSLKEICLPSILKCNSVREYTELIWHEEGVKPR